jgi:hypothetical protein
MDASKLARLREAVRSSRSPGPGQASGARVPAPGSSEGSAPHPGSLGRTLGGVWLNERTLVVEREYPTSARHGGRTIAEYAAAAERHAGALELLSRVAARADSSGQQWLDLPGEPRGHSRLVFFDLETTGLSGGAGTCAFLVGCGYFDGGAFHTHQFFLPSYPTERALLETVGEFMDEADAIITFNGRAFDLPLIEMRYLFHRMTCPLTKLPHLDLLLPARRLWRRRDDGPEAAAERPRRWPDGRASAPGLLAAERSSCALTALEAAILRVVRHSDVPGFEIPGRYFQYVRSGDPRPLVAVLEHNRLDLLSLAALTSVVARLVEEGPQAAGTARECFALGRLYDQVGDGERATACYRRAGGLEGEGDAIAAADAAVRVDALQVLARRMRSERRHAEAVEAWDRIVTQAGGNPWAEREAAEALAIHHEHRSGNLDGARMFALRALAAEPDPVRQEAVRHRLARLDRKIAARQREASLDEPSS